MRNHKYASLCSIIFSKHSEVTLLKTSKDISRLLEMGVLEEPSAEDLEQGVILSTRSVMDWRVHDQEWQRRCRFVAKEFKGTDRGTAATFAPTSGIGACLLLIAHCCLGWFLSFVDIKDAFLAGGPA